MSSSAWWCMHAMAGGTAAARPPFAALAAQHFSAHAPTHGTAAHTAETTAARSASAARTKGTARQQRRRRATKRKAGTKRGKISTGKALQSQLRHKPGTALHRELEDFAWRCSPTLTDVAVAALSLQLIQARDCTEDV